ncbi:amidophosphoribosyltransferase [Methanocella conradii HZ254]|uniref:Amidophosphoribosyltransferase n=1 Tax=Methanocella conradii (strain DSM 24694 / JCM 17849 / CGMCC 1.5162 / HZ254) TaxID=1041930 RepID=H8I4Y1_METCZ|nr:amidophosphoribosyltransferase [Methanocella conradii]AFD01075.1 amidophosphoribosyltransferase [Methanocella conradii HZ254]MDI6897836.1 amidophosphoribosyltransferase [Methanocella conradii]
MRDKCGVVGVRFDAEKNRDAAALYIYYALQALQHRGQESAGIAVTNGSCLLSDKGMGLVSDYFSRERLQKLAGYAGIGHVRYSTTGGSRPENSQPYTVTYKGGTIAIAHNGNLVNYRELKKELEAEGRVFNSDSDTEVIAQMLARELIRNDIVEAVKEAMKRLVGSYSLVILIGDKVIGVRDPLGFKPLCIGRVDGGYVLASESAAIDTLNGELVRDVAPGEMVVLGDKIESYRLFRCKNHAHCMFEYVYFARPDSIIDGRLVYKVRHKIGETLARECPTEADIVSPVPDSGITSAIGYSNGSSIPYAEALIKNRYVNRTFIMPVQELRETAVRLKLNTVRSNIEGKRVILIDDSIVRGTTSRRIVDLLRRGGAREIHVRIGSPPIISPCYLGIDMATREELIAAHKSVKGVEFLIGATSLYYISLDGLVDAIGMPKEDLCMGCLTGVYPIEIPGEKCEDKQMKLNHFVSE